MAVSSLDGNVDRECRALTVCGAVGVEFQTLAPTVTSDRTYATTAACKDTEWELHAATATSDRLCKAHTICDRQHTTSPMQRQHLSTVFVPRTVCALLARNGRQAPGAFQDRDCAMHMTCSEGSEYETRRQGQPRSAVQESNHVPIREPEYGTNVNFRSRLRILYIVTR